jgi:restriction system protein
LEPVPDCPGEGCLLTRLIAAQRNVSQNGDATRPQALASVGLFQHTPYDDAAPAIRDSGEFRSGVETLAYALFRLANNRLTRAERPRLENLVENAVFKMNRYLERGNSASDADRAEFESLKDRFLEDRRLVQQRRNLAVGIRTRMEQLDTLDGVAFEEFVAEVFEALGYEVDRNGGSGDEGADLKLSRGPLRAVVQCKYHAKGIVGSPELQKFLGTIHQSGSRKGYFVTTTGFTLSAEKFAANQPMELIDGPRLAEIVREVLTQAKPPDHEAGQQLPFGVDDDSRQRLASR